MPRKRQDEIPKPKLSIWMQDGKRWKVNRSDLLEAIKSSSKSDLEIQNRMGRGYHHIAEALDGKSLDIWGLKHIEWGLDI